MVIIMIKNNNNNKIKDVEPESHHCHESPYRVLKWWRHKNEISEITGFVRIFWKNNFQETYLPKMSIAGQIVSEMLAGYTQKTPDKPF